MTTTCQICGRVIKSNNSKGLISHHGYQRPGNGWQTASCMGARHLPYEISCDVLPKAIEEVTAYIETNEKWLNDFVANPPLVLLYRKQTGGSWNPSFESIPVNCPEGFNPETVYKTYRRGAYDTIYFNTRYEVETKIKYAKDDLIYLEDRLKKWVEPVVDSTGNNSQNNSGI